ncbi:hypothetical protein FHQ26_04945 [Testudinibacter sp. TR-2022]|uniref:SMI1/KNR4 family protein n=1 Tax=Testudinibacter sp. TR-2022 TaxID=2585029 RepID=UPI00111A7772|nr:SMI1/KNR4 family protein [Testudinibacter sp. TR-2022]TNH02471.1 hypothetical protein FHQ22_09975 [Pasteurellaceae bacterium Phil31]TNH10555.1 hypothetical protein FHQ26_04945 [Testudinibacter sp. TR-2022]TNH10967.1 hypothetical protein FHQ25_03870 [Testudinibacter sp. TR-2022]TNH13626.1 hypothetical protein FIA56_06640 [Testudinibacter sp. TR-2022]TNH18166.1 hypothetical protein FHQ23_05775 [Testudinibacter sp. TR-2022]
MNIITKFQEIMAIQQNNVEASSGTLNPPVSDSELQKIENLLQESLPTEIKALYSFANGQNDDGNGIFFGDNFCRADEIIQQLEFSRSLIKPETKTIANPEQSEQLIRQIVDFYVGKAPKHKLFGLQKSWYKIAFECGPNRFGGPYIYASENTTEKERKILKIDFKELDNVSEIVKKLHELEQPTYKWDELNFVAYSNGKYEVERSAYDFDNQISFTSTPKNAIQKKYFHYKWLPIFSDGGGNYLGIDLDPDTKGKKGQVINFGRDEEDMFVLAQSLDDLFDKILVALRKAENGLLHSEGHLHETLKELANNQPGLGGASR